MYKDAESLEAQSIDTVESNGYTAYIIPDEDAQPPWGYDRLGSYAHWHSRCDIGGSDERVSPDEFLERAKREKLIYLPLSLYEHSGMTIWVGSETSQWDQAGWDSGLWGSSM